MRAGLFKLPCWLLMAGLALPLTAQPPPADGDPCALDPAYIAWSEDCVDLREGDPRRLDACAWAPVVDHLIGGRRGDAEASLGRAFDLPAEKRSGLLDAATFFAPLLLTSSACPMEGQAGLMDVYKELMTRQILRGPEGFAVIGRLSQVDPRALAEISSREKDEMVRRNTERAAQGYADLFVDSVGLGRARSMLSQMPMAGRHPGLFPTTHAWDPSLRDIAPHLEALDLALEAGVDGYATAERFRKLAAAVDTMPSDRVKAFAWTRAGVGLLILGRPIEAWTALTWAEDRYRRLDSDAEPDKLVSFGRYLARSHQMVAAIYLEMMPEAMRLMMEIGASGSELESSLSELALRVLSAPAERALKTSLDAFEKKPMPLEQQELFLLGFQIMLPGFAGSPDAIQAYQEAQSSAPTWEGQPSNLTAVPEALILHGVEEALDEWRHFARLAPHWHQAISAVSLMQKALFEDGDFYLARRVMAAIIDFYEQDLDPLWADDLVRGALDARVSRFYPWAFELSIEAGAPPEESFAYSERGRAYGLRRLLGLPPGATALPSSQERELEAEIVALVHTDPKSTRLGEARGRFVSARLERRLLEVESELPSFPAPADLATLQSEVLLGHETLLAYFPATEHLHIWVIRRDDVQRRAVPWPLADLAGVAGRVERTRWVGATPEACRALRGVELCSTPETTISENWLYERLIAPVADLLGIDASEQSPSTDSGETTVPRLVIVPYGELHHVPWAALRTPDGGRLVEKHEVVVVPSADVFTSIRKRDPVRDTAPSSPALVLGDPVLGDPALGDSESSTLAARLPPLPGARREAREVADLFGVEPLLGERATEASLFDRARNAHILHIAAHGLPDSEYPLFSRLHLAAGDGQDGFLHTHEIWDRLQLCKARLVALSACDSAAGESSGGDDLIGLTQAFLVAGAPAVISTLWSVDDPASAALMTSFYRHFQAGATAGAALRAAQLERLRTHEHTAPHYWAGYVLIGDAETRWDAERSFDDVRR